ncbi:28128_t:CDS:2, partial [Racocetra persica]
RLIELSAEQKLELANKKIEELEEIKTNLEQELNAERAAAQELFTKQLSFYQKKHADLFSELEKRQKARFEKQEVEQQKNKQIKEKRKILSKLQTHSQNIKNLNAIRQDLTEKHNVEKANHQTTKTDYRNTVINLAKEKGRVKKANLARGEILKKSLELKNDLTNAQKQNQILQNKIQQ